MSAFHHYELLCDAPGCSATCNVGEVKVGATRRKAEQLGWTARYLAPGPRAFDLCPDHAGSPEPIPEAGEPMPAVCVDEVELPVIALREIRDCLAERVRWFESRGRAVPEATRLAAADVAEAIRFAAGEGRLVEDEGRRGHGALVGLVVAAVKHADATEPPCIEWDDDEVLAAERALWDAARAYARSLSKADRERLGR